jgi:hypothetical protein
VVGGNIFARVQSAQAANLNELGQRLEQIQIALNKLLQWAQQQQAKADDDSGADWWKN